MKKMPGYPDYSATKPPSSKFIPELWKTSIIVAVYDKIHRMYPKLILKYEGDIRRQGDMVWFGPGLLRHGYGLIVDKNYIFVSMTPDPILIQEDLAYLNAVVKDIAENIVQNAFGFSANYPALFAAQITDVEATYQNHTFASAVRGQLAYGYRSLNPIRIATEIIARCQEKGFTDDQTIKELGLYF